MSVMPDLLRRARVTRSAAACPAARRSAVCALAALTLLCAAPAYAASRAPRARSAGAHVITSTGALDRTLSGDLADAGGQGSALVVDETTGRTLFAATPTAPRLPASVEKLFTTSAALFDFGASHRFATQLLSDGTLSPQGLLTGTLTLRGGGDPSFGDAHFDHVMYGTGATIQTLLARLRAAGVRRVSGRIFGDPSIFDDRAGGPDTGYRANLETEGELSGLAYDAGFTSSAATHLQPHPALWAARALAAVAPTRGIYIAPHTLVSAGLTPAGSRVVSQVLSPSLATLVQLTNTPSDNFFAETLLKDLGARFGGAGSTSAGATVVARTDRTRLGLPVFADDGSGLSRADRVSATTVVQLLEEMQSSSMFVNSLAVAGHSGTMIDEMVNTPGANNCRGKTGTHSDVANLVGYCTAANGHRLVFAFLENGIRDTYYGHETEDRMGEALAEYAGTGAGSAAPLLPRPDAGAGVR